MRRRFRVLILAAIVAAVVVRVGFALSLQSGSFQTPRLPESAVIMNSAPASALLLLASNRYAPVQQSPFLPDDATLLALGTVLLGLAAAVRRAV